MGALLCLTVVGVALMDLGIQVDSFDSLCAPVPCLLYPLVIDIELGQECLEINLFLDG